MQERRSIASPTDQAAPRPRSGGVVPIRVLLAEDHALLRLALRQLLERQEEIEVVGDVGDGHAAVEAAERTRPDVVLMDLAMPGLNGIEATRQITERLRNVRVLMLTGHEYDERIMQALRAGATGYLLKNADLDELLLAIRTVRTGNSYFSAAITADHSAIELLVRARTTADETGPSLTNREREVLQLIVEGHRNQEIADKLFLSLKTVEAYRARLMQKLGAHHLADLVRYALRTGILIEQPESRADSANGG